ENIYNFIDTGKGSAIVVAVAGSGKTTTIVNGMQYIPNTKRVIFLAFNKSIAMELGTKLPAFVSCKTLNAAGMGAFRDMVSRGGRAFFKVDKNKTRDIIAFLGINYDIAEVAKLVALGKSYGVAPRAMRGVKGVTEDTDEFWINLMEHYDMEVPQYRQEAIIDNVVNVLRAGLQDTKTIDFDDQLYMPVVLGARFDTYDWVFVDEAQDVSPVQRAMLKRLLSDNGGRLIAVGDPCQCHPAGTMIELTGGDKKPVEDIVVGDMLVTYHDCFRGISRQGRKVLNTSKRAFDGNMITISSGDKSVSVTPDHKIPTKLHSESEKTALYLMESGNTSRIGCCKLMYSDGFGPSMRMRHERADRVWVLDVFDDKDDALIAETVVALKYGLPENIFFEKGMLRGRLVEAIGNNRDKAITCLDAFNRIYKYPLHEKGSKNHTGRYLYISQACNLIAGVSKVRTFDGTRDGGSWEILSISRKKDLCDVFSINVEPAEGGHRLYIADQILVHNSIYGFRGSDSESLSNIAKEFDAIELPLSMSYRCPRKVVEYAQQVVSHIEASPTAIEGSVQRWKEFTGEEFTRDDMIICRNTAPLVKVAYGLIGRHIPAKVIGRDIGTNLIKLIDRLKPKGIDGDNGLIVKLDAWKQKETEKLLKADKEDQIQGVEDKYDTLKAFIQGSKANTVPQIKQAIEDLFGGDQKNAIPLCTVHKSKGLEAKRVFVLDDHLMPSKYACKEWQQDQENNLRYVAYTRAQEDLIFIDSDTLIDKRIKDINDLTAPQQEMAL
ncbi:MAG: AAA family ATPase, partial [Spirochaetales bacterium]|nr:AAA family ATPase [Spirochaetales bacterium]